MAKPINLYQGPAPGAMSQMGAGLAEAGANIGRSLQQGYQSLGQGIAGGISAAAGAYKEYKDLQSQVKGSEKMFESLKSYLPKDVQTAFDAQIQELNTNGSLKDKAAFYEQAKGFLGSSVANTLAIQKQQKELDARLAMNAADIASREGQPMRQAVAGYMFPEERQSFGGPGALFGPTAIPQQNVMTAQPQNIFAQPKNLQYHIQPLRQQ